MNSNHTNKGISASLSVLCVTRLKINCDPDLCRPVNRHRGGAAVDAIIAGAAGKICKRPANQDIIPAFTKDVIARAKLENTIVNSVLPRRTAIVNHEPSRTYSYQ